MLLGTGLIVFRETLEAALFVGIVAATTRHISGRNAWLAIGIVFGICGSIALAFSMDALAILVDGLGQDLLTVFMLSLALLMLAWHAINAPQHAREASLQAKRIGAEAASENNSLMALMVAVSLAIMREGAETVIFVAGSLSGSTASNGELILSVASGLATGALAGWLLYRGLGKVNPKRLFTVTNGLILLLAGGLASQLVRTLNQANWLTALDDKAWDFSQWLPNDSTLGTLLRGLVGYDANPSLMQLVGYLATVGLIAFAASLAKTRFRTAKVA